jgi:translation initiation factor IF-2
MNDAPAGMVLPSLSSSSSSLRAATEQEQEDDGDVDVDYIAPVPLIIKADQDSSLRMLLASLNYEEEQEGEGEEGEELAAQSVNPASNRQRAMLEKLRQLECHVLHASIGAVTSDDVLLAHANKIPILCFRLPRNAANANLIKRFQINVQHFDVFYDLLDEVLQQEQAWNTKHTLAAQRAAQLALDADEAPEEELHF